MITYEECLYQNAQLIVQTLVQTDFLKKPVFIILRSNGTTHPEDILKMTFVLLHQNNLPVYPALISINGINIIDQILSEKGSKILVSETIVSYSICYTTSFPIQLQKQCERIFQNGCSVITALSKNSEFDQISQELTKIGYNLIILNELDDIQIDFESLFKHNAKQPPHVAILMRKYSETYTKVASSDDHWVDLPRINPDDPPNIVYFPEKVNYQSKYPFKIFIGKTEVDCFENLYQPGWVEAKQMYCPHCMKDIVLGRDSRDDPFKYHPCFDLHSGLVLVDEVAFWQHMGVCPPPFSGDGIHEVQSEPQREIAAALSLISKRECRWDAPTIASFSFDEGARAFILIRDGVPVSYIAFQEKKFSEVGSKYILCDLYTFPKLRKQGLSSSLLDYAIRVLEIDKDFFFISFPVREGAKNIIMSRVGQEIVMVRPGINERVEKDELLENWDDFNS